MIRKAEFSDAGRMVEILQEAHLDSVYAEIDLDRAEANRIMVNMIQRHGGRGVNGTWSMVAERDGKVNGLIIGVLTPVYHVGSRCTASDLYWIPTKATGARDSMALMVSLVEWAKIHPRCFDIVCATPPTISDPEKLAKLMARIGFKPFGGLWRIEVEK